MATQADLDAALAALQANITTQTAAIDAAVSNLLAKAQAVAPAVDYTSEVASIQAAIASVNGIAGQLPTKVADVTQAPEPATPPVSVTDASPPAA